MVEAPTKRNRNEVYKLEQTARRSRWDDVFRHKEGIQVTIPTTTGMQEDEGGDRGEREAKKSAKALRKEVAMISKKAAAAKSLKETSGWSGVAIGAVTLLWAGFAEYGYPGPQWLFEHDIFYGAVCWMSTSLFAWAAKAFYDAQ